MAARRLFRWVAWVLLGGFAAGAALAEEVPASKIFDAFGEKKSDRERGSYLKEAAHSVVAGSGNLETLTPRRFYDTSVPDNAPVIAVIIVDQSRKVVCGLQKEVFDTLGWLREGTPVKFQGRLSDAQNWSQGITLYLSDCTIARR